MNQKLAVIDLGTNTFHLMIAEINGRKNRIIHTEKVAVKLGKAGINQDIIQEDAIDRAIGALKDFKSKMDYEGVAKIHAFGTSALRNATNANAVTERIKSSTGIDISIISGDEEAEMIYQGVQSALDLGNETSLIMDIGAGSVEFILANRTKTLWKRSLEIGGQRILELYKIHDPITSNEIQQLDRFLESSLAEVHNAIQLYPPVMLVGSSGTFDTLSDLYCAENSIVKNESDSETPLTIEYIQSVYHRLIKMNRTERMNMIGMIELRVDLIVVGCCLVRYVLEKYKLKQVRVSRYSLKEGALAQIASGMIE
jgi:exopolyphosphatase / guanosine-5'-triphosphate,3'-diphosphate pyrophosphatase